MANLREAFRNGEIQLLVTTDVMGRGLDIPGISHVGPLGVQRWPGGQGAAGSGGGCAAVAVGFVACGF